MRHKNPVGFSLLVLSAVFLLISLNPTITGSIIGVNEKISPVYLVSLIFFISSVLIFASRQTLDAIMIPTGSYKTDKERTERAYEEGKDKPGQVYLITGRIDKPVKTSQVYSIYKQLRSYGIKPGKIRIEGKSANTLEKLKQMGAHDVGIASNPTHLDSFEDLIKEAKKEGIAGNDLRVHRLTAPESFRDWVYGIVHRTIYRYELAHGGLKAVGKTKLGIKKKIIGILDRIMPEE